MLKDFNKRLFDLGLSSIFLLLFSWLILVLWVIASFSTHSNGFYSQLRIGRHGRPFRLIKIKTMIDSENSKTSSITALELNRITKVGAWIRKFKLDELPQLLNIFLGEMSFVGPRPDVPGYADKLNGHDRLILELRPGITGPASIKYRKEEEMLAACECPEKYNDEIIWPDKVKINLDYYSNHSLSGDIKLILSTIALSFSSR